MPLMSKLFASPLDAKLEQCRVNNAGHIALNANNKGAHVGKIQQALVMISRTDNTLAGATSSQGFANEHAAQTYGPATAAAVLRFKQDRHIVNTSYQKTADNVVGKMTIVSLDQTVAIIEAGGAKRIRLLPYIGLHTFESPDPRAFAPPVRTHAAPLRTAASSLSASSALRIVSPRLPTAASSLMPSMITAAAPSMHVGDGATTAAEHGKQWSVASISYMHSVAKVGQFGIVLYSFRNDETKQTAIYMSPQFGAGISLMDLVQFLGWLKNGRKLGGEVIKIADEAIEKVIAAALRGGNFKDTIIGVMKEIAKALASGLSVSAPWSPYSKAEVFMPVWFERLNEKTIGGGGASLTAYSVGKLYVYGKVWCDEADGRIPRTRDLMCIDTNAWFDGLQLPGASAAGGPLLKL